MEVIKQKVRAMKGCQLQLITMSIGPAMVCLVAETVKALEVIIAVLLHHLHLFLARKMECVAHWHIVLSDDHVNWTFPRLLPKPTVQNITVQEAGDIQMEQMHDNVAK